MEYQRPDVVGLPVSLAPRPVLLAGREQLLDDLHDRLSAGDDPRPRVAALHGLGGAGKTTVAVEYAYRHLAETGLTWQFPAGDPTVLTAEFSRLAAQLGARDVLDARDPVTSVHAVLASHPARWLLVFDNAPDQKAVQRFLPPTGPGRVLITSQSPFWPPSTAVEVPVLDRLAAAEFLVNRTNDPDTRAAEELAEELGGLPLALEQAAAYLHAAGGSLAEYLDWFRQRRADLLARGELAGHDETVVTTWALPFARLERSAPGAAGLLRLLAFCAPEAVPLRLLLQSRAGLTEDLHPEVAAVLVPVLEDTLAAKDAIVALRRYSLITLAVDGSASVHRLVQAVTADQMPAELASAWRRAAAMVIEAAIPSHPSQPGTWPDFAALLPHARASLAADSEGMRQIASYLGFSGSYVAARELSGRVLDARVGVLGADHPKTLTVRAKLARWTGQAGDPAEARDQYAALLPISEGVSGPEHPDTLSVREGLAHWTGEAGDPARARDQYAALLPVVERVLGPEHPKTLADRGNLARWTGDAGDPAGARDQYAALLPADERVLGPEHPETLEVRAVLARWTGAAGDPAGARDQFAALLPIHDRVLGPEHPLTLGIRQGLARWTGAAGDPAGARDQFAALVPIRERVLGPEHPDTLVARDHLARWTGHAGDPAAARDQYAALLPVIERVSGPEHQYTLGIREGLAYWTGAAGDPAGARDQYAALLPARERVSGPEHPHTLWGRGNLARWTGEAGDPAGARDQYAALLPADERVLGPEHPDTLADRADLAYWTAQAEAAN